MSQKGSSPPPAKRPRPDTSPPKPMPTLTSSGASAAHGKAEIVLYSYWRSSCSWRVRFALAMKKIPYKYEIINLVLDGGQQHSASYSQTNPMKQVPTLVIGDKSISQSMAIMEFLEESYPEPRLLPQNAFDRATVRKLCLIIVADIQPVQNLRVLKKIAELNDQATSKKWARDTIANGLAAYEKEIAPIAGNFSFGDVVTMADICLVPQVYNAFRYEVNMSLFPNIQRVYANLQQLSEYKISHPESQPDCPDKQ
eukprot:TRINITY_DN4803_c0_g1_i1.p1 TRINITY_DN4803_c0_g1~~TRINITY_DN4803_c0_g1_i1.p1  ORF type:complete len:254 (+),score=72.09 TRINITY_DN4803_c0_g1_i1:176-937(+)